MIELFVAFGAGLISLVLAMERLGQVAGLELPKAYQKVSSTHLLKAIQKVETNF